MVNVTGCSQRIITGGKKGLVRERLMGGRRNREREGLGMLMCVHIHNHTWKKSGQPFRLPVPWLVHYAEAFLTCKKRPVSALKHPGPYFSRSAQYGTQTLIPCLPESAYTNPELLTRLIWEIMNLSKYGGPRFAFSYENSIYISFRMKENCRRERRRVEERAAMTELRDVD